MEIVTQDLAMEILISGPGRDNSSQMTRDKWDKALLLKKWDQALITIMMGHAS